MRRARRNRARLRCAAENEVLAEVVTNTATSKHLRTLAALAVPALALLFGAAGAFASTDTTFQGPLDTVTGIVGGTGGQLAAALAVGAALVGSVMRFNTQQLLGAVGVGVAAGAGVGIVTGLVGTAIV